MNRDPTRFFRLFNGSLMNQAVSHPAIEAEDVERLPLLSHTNKLPRDLLQRGLNPVLASLQTPSELSTHWLGNLARLLKLLTTYFRVEIGRRLLDHISVLAEPATLQQISFTFFEQNPQMKVIEAVINIYHLLPPAAESFKERLINTVLDLEEKLRRTHQSPFRAPLYKFINRFPKEVWAHLLHKLDEIKYGRFLAQMLRHPDNGPC